MTAPVSIGDLPPELLSHIFDYLSGPAPSDVLLHEQPHADMLSCTSGGSSYEHAGALSPLRLDIKSVSRVSKLWRSFVLSRLIRSVLWRPQMMALELRNLDLENMLQFLLSNSLESYVTTFTFMVDFSADNGDDNSQLHQQMPYSDMEWLWDKLFSVINPMRFTIIAPPATLAALMNRMLFLTDAWSFDIPYHILSLARPGRGEKRALLTHRLRDDSMSLAPSEASTASQNDDEGTSSQEETPRKRGNIDWISSEATGHRSGRPSVAPASSLFTARPWTSVLLNEGSSVRAYETYEFFLRQPPSMLSALLGAGEYPNNEPLLPQTITDFNYIAVFPLASHVATLLDDLPKVERLFLQLTPRPSNQILQDQRHMRHIDRADLWMERNTAYSQLLNELMNHEPASNWSSLKLFESGDATDKGNWNMAVDFLEQRDVANWKPERDGVLVKVNEDGSSALTTAAVAHHNLGVESQDVARVSVTPIPPLSIHIRLADAYLWNILLAVDSPSTASRILIENIRNHQAVAGGLVRKYSLYSLIGRSVGSRRVHRIRSGELVSDIDMARSLGI